MSPRLQGLRTPKAEAGPEPCKPCLQFGRRIPKARLVRVGLRAARWGLSQAVLRNRGCCVSSRSPGGAGRGGGSCGHGPAPSLTTGLREEPRSPQMAQPWAERLSGQSDSSCVTASRSSRVPSGAARNPSPGPQAKWPCAHWRLHTRMPSSPQRYPPACRQSAWNALLRPTPTLPAEDPTSVWWRFCRLTPAHCSVPIGMSYALPFPLPAPPDPVLPPACDGLNCPPQKKDTLTPQPLLSQNETLFGKRVPEDVIGYPGQTEGGGSLIQQDESLQEDSHEKTEVARKPVHVRVRQGLKRHSNRPRTARIASCPQQPGGSQGTASVGRNQPC